MAIRHIVLFGWKKTATPEQIDDAYGRMLALKEKCLHPTSKQPYIKSSIGGRNNSPEEPARGLDHGFIVEFENKEDRDYYLDKDPEHLAFIEFVGPLLENVKVFDFEPGKF